MACRFPASTLMTFCCLVAATFEVRTGKSGAEVILRGEDYFAVLPDMNSAVSNKKYAMKRSI